ncbi:HAD-IB family phosphatase [Acinetobacter schindleri]|uniref:HAD-IB family phosphatase n=1 Tax=Acinetobacter schindleri TaxID=108981 RepID=UPI00235DFBF3|nr:HAD-IB family phosphatase [Acinetobacter schindleri]WDE14996.1 HAD-IB family phosphatase [Acinetobacter schindleri]
MHAQNQKPQALALFDFDGTLYSHDSFTGFIFYALRKRHIVKRGLQILPWIQAYYLNFYPAHRMRPKLYASMFKNSDAEEILKLAQDYAQQLIFKLNPKLLEQLIQHQELGHEVVLVSASLDLYLKPVCSYLNIDLICSEVEIKAGKITGFYQTPDCSNQQKKISILEKYNLDNYAEIYAYGNSEEDEEMLSLANYPYLVGKNQQLPQILNYKNLA